MDIFNLKRYSEDLIIALASSDNERLGELENKLKILIKRTKTLKTKQDIFKYLKNNKHIQSSTYCLNFVETLERESQ